MPGKERKPRASKSAAANATESTTDGSPPLTRADGPADLASNDGGVGATSQRTTADEIEPSLRTERDVYGEVF
jgi:hypothetical protein